jgi:peptidoglycan/LPS O-acetylase OafA/YrhL
MFLGLRVIRIWPALLVEIVLSAFILGPLLTEFSTAQYFSDPLFFRYFINILGEPQYFLPGLFLNNPAKGYVNYQLWTIPFELGCYIAISAIGVIGARKRHFLAPLSAAVLMTIYVAYRIHAGQPAVPAVTRPVAGPLLVIAFLLGVTAYFYRSRIPANPLLNAAILIFSIILLSNPVGQIPALVGLTYVTVYVGTLNPTRMFITKGADYSYGLYLYGFPIQQALVDVTTLGLNPVLNAVTTLVIAGIFAGFSWTYVEKPALKLRTFLKMGEERILSWRGKTASRLTAG